MQARAPPERVCIPVNLKANFAERRLAREIRLVLGSRLHACSGCVSRYPSSLGSDGVQHQSWQQLVEAYTFKDGNLWPLVLVVTFVAPLLAVRVRSRP